MYSQLQPVCTANITIIIISTRYSLSFSFLLRVRARMHAKETETERTYLFADWNPILLSWEKKKTCLHIIRRYKWNSLFNLIEVRICEITCKINSSVCYITYIDTAIRYKVFCIWCCIVIYSNEIKGSCHHFCLWFCKFWQPIAHQISHGCWVVSISNWMHNPTEIIYCSESQAPVKS